MVIRRATLAGWVVAAVVALLAAVLVFALLRPGPRFLIVWLLLIAGAAGLAFKVTQRVAFEVVRSRGVPPPEV